MPYRPLKCILFYILYWLAGCEAFSDGFKAERVAHAGGALRELTYTNSLDALNLNRSKGFRYFELDLLFTKDNALVCGHSWTSKNAYTNWEKIPTEEEFLRITNKLLTFSPCTLKTLAEWLKSNPDTFIVTDIKTNNIQGLALIATQYPALKERFIPQIYQPEELKTVRELGYKSVIWTLYQYKGTHDDILAWEKKMTKPYAIAMSKKRSMSSLPVKLKQQNPNIILYAHTINQPKTYQLLIKNKLFSEVYTDTLTVNAEW